MAGVRAHLTFSHSSHAQQDEFSKCFEPSPLERSWMLFQAPFRLYSILIRYTLLFPYRFIVFSFASMLFFATLPFVYYLKSPAWMHWLFYCYCKVWTFAFGAIIRHHGVKPHLSEPHVFVCNHTSVIDYFVLSSHKFAHASSVFQ